MTLYTHWLAPPATRSGVATQCDLRRYARTWKTPAKPAGLDGWEDDGGSLAVSLPSVSVLVAAIDTGSIPVVNLRWSGAARAL